MNKVYIDSLHRAFSESEIRELAALIREYVDANPHADRAEISEGIVSLGMLYDEALQLRYNVKNLPPR